MLEFTIALTVIMLAIFFFTIAERKLMASMQNWVSGVGAAFKKKLAKGFNFSRKKKTIPTRIENLVVPLTIFIDRGDKRRRPIELPNYVPPSTYDEFFYHKYWLIKAPIPKDGLTENGDDDFYYEFNKLADKALNGDLQVGMREHIYLHLVRYRPPNPFKRLLQGTQAWWEEIEKLRNRRHVEFMDKANKFLGTLDKWRVKWIRREAARLQEAHEDYIIYNDEFLGIPDEILDLPLNYKHNEPLTKGYVPMRDTLEFKEYISQSLNDEQSWLFDERSWWRVKGTLLDRLHEVSIGQSFQRNEITKEIESVSPDVREVTHHFADYFYAMQDAYRVLHHYRKWVLHTQFVDDVDMSFNNYKTNHVPTCSKGDPRIDFLTFHNPKTGQPMHFETWNSIVKDRATAIKSVPDLRYDSIKDWYYSRFIVHPYEVDYEYRNIQGALKVMRLGRAELRDKFIELYTYGQASDLKLESKYSFLHRNADMMSFFYKFDFLDFVPFFLILGAFSIVFYCFHFFFREGWLEFGEWGVFGKNKHMMAGGDFLFEKIRFLVYPIIAFWCLWIFFFWGWFYHSAVEASYQDFFNWFWLSVGYEGTDWEREVATLQAFIDNKRPIDDFKIYSVFVRQVFNLSSWCLTVFILVFVLYVKKQLLVVFKQFKNELGADENIAYSNIFDSMHIYKNFFVSQKSSDLTLKAQKKLFTTWLGAYRESFKKSFIWKAFIILKVLILFFFISTFIKNIAFKQSITKLMAPYTGWWEYYISCADELRQESSGTYGDDEENYDLLMTWITLNRQAKQELFELTVNRFAEMWGDFIYILFVFLFFFCFIYLAFIVENHAKIESRIGFYDRGLQEIAELQVDDEVITTHFDPKVAKTLMYEYHDIDETPLLSAFYSLRFYESSVLDEKKKDEISTVEEGLMLIVFRVFMMEKEREDIEWKDYYMRPITELYGNLQNYSIWDEHLDEQYEDDEEWADDDMIDLDSELLHLELDRFVYIKWFLANVESEPVCYMEMEWDDELNFFSTDYEDDEDTWKL